MAKDEKSCELGEIGHSQDNLSLILGEKIKKPGKLPELPILSQSKPLYLGKFIIVGHFEPLQCETF